MVNLNGGNQKVGGKDFDKFVGLGAVQLIAANPTKEQLEEILGTTLENQPNYAAKPNDKGVNVKPLILWFRSETGAVISSYIGIANTPHTTNNGDKFMFVNSVGQMSFYVPDEAALLNNPKVMKWFKSAGLRKLNVGERELYELLQGFNRYNPSADNANWMEVMNSLEITSEGLMGSVKGLNEFINYLNANDNKLIMSHVVSVSTDDEGNTRERQQVLIDPETYFRTEDGEVKDYMIERLQKYSDSKISSGYSVTSKEFFIGRLRKFEASEIPAQVAELDNSPGESILGL